MTPMASLDVVIVNWNTGEALAACVASVVAAAHRLPATRIVVVDNGSADGSLAAAAGAVPGIVAVRNEVNAGFAAACNQGAKGSTADYLLFLNPDTVLAADTLDRVLAFMAEPAQDDVGICGIRLVDDAGRFTTAAARFPTLAVLLGEITGLSRLGMLPRHLLTADECRATRDVDQVIGAFFLIRRQLFEALGGFDERFFVYFEEVDLSRRARSAGWRSVYFAEAQALHHGGLSSDQVKAARLFYSLRGRLLYTDKHFAPTAAAVVRGLTFAVEQPLRLLRAGLAGGTALGETRTAFRRLRAFVATDWRHARDEQRRP